MDFSISPVRDLHVYRWNSICRPSCAVTVSPLSDPARRADRSIYQSLSLALFFLMIFSFLIIYLLRLLSKAEFL